MSNNFQQGLDSLFADNVSYKTELNSTNLRLGFIRKVYSILTAQLLATVLFTFLVFNSEFLMSVVRSQTILILSALTSIVLMLVFVFARQLSKTVPTNYILLGLFTLAESVTVAASCIDVEPRIVLMAMFLTAFITLSLTVYAMTTKSDITMMGGLFFMVGMGSLAITLLSFFFFNIIGYLIGFFLGTILYGLYLIYDTQLIVGGKRVELSVDDYIIGAMMLYVDIIVLFLRILKFLRIFLEKEDKKKN